MSAHLMVRKVHRFLAVPAAVLIIVMAITGLIIESNEGSHIRQRQGWQEHPAYSSPATGVHPAGTSSAVRSWHRGVSELSAYILLGMAATGLWLVIYPRLSPRK